MSLPLHAVVPLIGIGAEKALQPIPLGAYIFVAHKGSPFVDPPNVCSLFVVDHANPANQAFPYGSRGELPRGITRPYSMFSYKGGLYIIDDAHEQSIWLINPHYPSSEMSPYGKLADLTASRFGMDGAAVHDGNIYGVHASAPRDQLWRLNPDNWTDFSSPYGNRGQLPSGIGAADSAVSHNGNLYVFDANDHELWHVNPSSPGSTSGSYGRKGPLEDSTHSPFASASIDNKLILIDREGELWNVNPDSPSSTAGSYGSIGEMPGSMDIWSGTAHTIV